MSSRSLESGLRGPSHRGLPARVVHLAVGERVQAVDLSRPRQLDERHDLLVAGLEAHRGARRDVESHAPRLAALEAEGPVGLEEVEMRADLNGPVGRIGYRQLDSPTSFIRDDVALAQDVFARNHQRCPLTLSALTGSSDRMMNRDELGAVGEGAFDLHLL